MLKRRVDNSPHGMYFGGMRRLLSAAGAAILLTACQTEQPANQAQVQALGETCQAYGFQPGTNEFANCIFQMDQQRIDNNRQKRMAVAGALQGVGRGMQQRAQAYRPPVRCTSTPNSSWIGGPINSVSTTCN